jgi:hypothetical protein
MHNPNARERDVRLNSIGISVGFQVTLSAHCPAKSPMRWNSAQCLIFFRMRVSLCLVNLVFRSCRSSAG